MRKIIVALAGTASGLVMLFSYYTSTAGVAATAATGPANDQTGAAASPEPASPEPATSTPAQAPAATPAQTPAQTQAPAATSTTSSAKSGTFAGSAATTRWGPVQVQVTVANGRISKVTVLEHPQGNPRDTEINNYALPILTSETIAAQSAQIDHVSGATDTSDGYLTSLQSALDQAQL